MGQLFLAALLGSLLTIALLALLAQKLWLQVIIPRIEQEAEAIRQEFEKGLLETGESLIPAFREELEQAFGQVVEEFLPEFRKEVQEGFHEAGESLLPDYRRETQEAFEQALVDTLGGKLVGKTALEVAKAGNTLVGSSVDIMGKTALEVAKTGNTLMGAGLDLLLGKTEPRTPDKRP